MQVLESQSNLSDIEKCYVVGENVLLSKQPENLSTLDKVED